MARPGGRGGHDWRGGSQDFEDVYIMPFLCRGTRGLGVPVVVEGVDHNDMGDKTIYICIIPDKNGP